MDTGSCILIIMIIFKVYLLKEDVKEKGVILKLMEAILKVTLKITLQMDTGFLSTKQVINMKVNGKIICQMV